MLFYYENISSNPISALSINAIAYSLINTGIIYLIISEIGLFQSAQYQSDILDTLI